MSDTATALRKGTILRKGQKFMRVVSAGKTIRVQSRNGTRGRYGSETTEITSTQGWKIVNGDE